MATCSPHSKDQEDRDPKKPLWPAGYTPRVVLKFKDDEARRLQIPYDESVEQSPERYLGQNWSQLVGDFPGITFQRLITVVTPDLIRELVERGQRRRRDQNNKFPNFLTYFAVRCPSSLDPYMVLPALSSWQIVELAYVESGPLPPPNVTLDPLEDPSVSGQQRYLLDATLGINAKYAWSVGGGDGGGAAVGLQFVDVEQGWILNHQDLPTGIQQVHGHNHREFGHGTGTLGIVLAQSNNVVTVGSNPIKTKVGITPDVWKPMVSSIWPNAGATYVDRVNAIWAAIFNPNGTLRLNPGDIVLLEDHVWAYGFYTPTNTFGWHHVPIEVEDAIFHTIVDVAISNDIVVVEAAGNGGIDLDQFTPVGTSTWGQDSGAIMVAAADSPLPHDRTSDSNFGSRVDCWAWGNNVWTTGYDDPSGAPPDPTISEFAFSGTSSAAAIIAGAVLAIQGVAQTDNKGGLLNHRFSPGALRDNILRGPFTGTHSAKGSLDKIGLMPNLKAIIQDGLHMVPLHRLGDILSTTANSFKVPMPPGPE